MSRLNFNATDSTVRAMLKLLRERPIQEKPLNANLYFQGTMRNGKIEGYFGISDQFRSLNHYDPLANATLHGDYDLDKESVEFYTRPSTYFYLMAFIYTIAMGILVIAHFINEMNHLVGLIMVSAGTMLFLLGYLNYRRTQKKIFKFLNYLYLQVINNQAS